MLNRVFENAYFNLPSRDELITKGIPRVRRIAFRLARRLPPNVDVGDLIGAGTEGLLKAVDAYDPKVQPRFETYADTRIRGAMLDELRAHDQMTRYGRKRLGDVSKTIRNLRQSLGREPEEEEVAEAMDMDLLSYQKLTETLARGPALGRGGETEPDEVQSAVRDPLNIFEQKQLRGRLVKAIEELPERTRMVLALYYQEECTQAEIGEILGVSESRVCQILGESAARLRARLERDERTTPAKAAR